MAPSGLGFGRDCQSVEWEITMYVVLSESECAVAKMLGELRRTQDTGRLTRRDWAGDGLKNDVESLAAELAVAKVLNVYPDFRISSDAAVQFDLRWRGWRVDVKSTQIETGNLVIDTVDSQVLYVLVRGKMPHLEVVGCIQGNKVPTVGRWRTDLPYPCWFVDAELLVKRCVKG